MFTLGGDGSDLSRLTHSPSLDSVFRHDISMLLTSESRNDMKRATEESESGSRYASTLASPTLSTSIHEHDSSIPTRDYRSTNAFECITPLTRSQQLKILLARNYSSAPACMLSFVDDVLFADSLQTATTNINNNAATTSTGTLVDANVTDANDGARDSADTIVDGHGPNAALDNNTQVKESNASSNRTSLISSEDDAPHKSRGNCGRRNANTQATTRQKIDAGTSPLRHTQVECKLSSDVHLHKENASATVGVGEKAAGGNGVKGGTLEDGGAASSGCRSISIPASCAAAGASPIVEATDAAINIDNDTGITNGNEKEKWNNHQDITNSTNTGGGTNASPDSSPKSAASKALPVYCRSLLYRIRVPLWQRLKNGCNVNDVKGEGRTPGLSITRTNLSCDRSREYLPGLRSVGSAGKVPSSCHKSNDSTATSEDSPGLKLKMSDLETDSMDDDNSPCFSFFKNPGNFTLCTTTGGNRNGAKIKSSNGIVMAGKKWVPGKLLMLGPKDLNSI